MLKLHPGKGRQEGWGGPSPDCLLGQRGPHVTVSVHTSNWFTVKSYHPQKNELIWALATVTSSAWRRPTAVLGRKMLGIKGVCTYGCGVFLNNQTPKAKVNDSAFSSRPLGWVSSVCSSRSLCTLVSAMCQEMALYGPYQLAPLPTSFQLGLNKGSTGRRTEGGSRVQDIYSPCFPSPLLLAVWRFDSGCAHSLEASRETTALISFWRSLSLPALWGISGYRMPFCY